VGINNLSISSTSNFGYLGLYSAILYTNVVLNYEQYLAADAEITDLDYVAELQAEARIIRGLAHFYLLEWFSSTPTSGQHQEYGVPIVLSVFNPSDRF